VTDIFEKQKRSEIMSRIRAYDTKPEMIVRSVLHRAGYRFRLHRASLPGKPDIVLARYCTAIFVHGCFWHQHKGCKRATMPKSNREYWMPKLLRNVERFKEVSYKLTTMGWQVVEIWECETRDLLKLENKIKLILKRDCSE
jgi:DNA mismatch endonuclease (patch repair protein)